MHLFLLQNEIQRLDYGTQATQNNKSGYEMQTKTILSEIVTFLGLCVQISGVKQDNKG